MQKIGVILLAIAALTVGIVVQKISPTDFTNEKIDLSKTTLPDLTNTRQSLSTWQGKILVINFWATWCPPCLKEIPDFMVLQNEYKTKNVQFIGIALDDEAEVKRFQLKTQVNYPLLIANNSGMALARSWGNVLEVVPFTVIVNANGEIVHRKMGEFSRADLQKVLTSLLNTQTP